MNKVSLVGRLTRDPEMRTSQTGGVITRFTVAVDRTYTTVNGERETDFISCVAFSRLGETVARYCRKGMLVSVDGSVRTGSYDAQDGTKRYTTDIACNQVEFLSRVDNNSTNPATSPVDNQVQENIPSTDLEDPFKSFGDEIAVSNNDLPF